jgi:hypothetical protein
MCHMDVDIDVVFGVVKKYRVKEREKKSHLLFSSVWQTYNIDTKIILMGVEGRRLRFAIFSPKKSSLLCCCFPTKKKLMIDPFFSSTAHPSEQNEGEDRERWNRRWI